MIVKLRRKFIGIAMCSMALVLTLMIAGINIASFVNVCQNADRRITMIADNNGRLPQNMKDGKAFSPDQRKTKQSLSPEAAFDTRFFTITFLPDGEIAQTDLGKIASISSEDAKDYAEALYEKGRRSGFIDCYRYRAQQTAEGKTMYIFVNCERELNAFYTFLTASVGISLLGLSLVFLLVVIFSRIMMRPVAESYWKQKRFITDASHEIKTPLTIIDANTEILEMTGGENKWTKIRSLWKCRTLNCQTLSWTQRSPSSLLLLPGEKH